MKVLRCIKRVINNFIEKLTKENEKFFGKGTLDCCQLNQQSSSKK